MTASSRKPGFAETPQAPYGSDEPVPGLTEVTVHQAKTHLSRLLVAVEAGGSVVITRRGKPVARLERLEPRPKRVFGSMKGQIAFDDTFFDPLPEDELRAWEGE